MILKVVSYERREGKEGVWETANYIDRIINASISFDDDADLPYVKCTLENSAVISISVPNVAYLMNDSGKTIEKIKAPEVCLPGESPEVFPDLHEAVNAAVNASME